MRRLQTLNPAAFLVDQHRRIRSADRCLEIRDEAPDLIRLDAIALKQDEAGRVGGAEEIALRRIEAWPGAAEDQRLWRLVTV